MPQTELLREDEISSGVGANIFFRKKRPGPTIGDGYVVEIYENGVKIDEKEVKGKKEIKELVDLYKTKYNTLRSFQNEVLTHVTYKTKEERGEDLTPPAEQEKVIREERENNQQERGEIAMQAVDQILIKKAGQIHGLLQRLVNPETPIKKRADANEVGDPNFLPETPEVSGMESTKVTEDSVAAEITKKIVEYFNAKITASPEEGTDKETTSAPITENTPPAAPIQAPEDTPLPITANSNKERTKVSYEKDDLYNDIKGWLTKVKKIFKDHERTTGKKFDKNKIIGLVKTPVTSGNPEEIQKVTGISVSKEVAEIMRDIMSKSTGTPKPGQVTQQLGKNTEMAGGTLTDTIGKDLPKTAATIEDKIVKVVGLTNSGKEGDAHDFLKEVGIQELDEFKELPDTMGGNTIKNIIKEILQEAGGSATKNNANEDTTVIEICASEFWNYAGSLNRVASVDRIFEEWVSKKGMTLDNALSIWNKIQTDISEAFNKKLGGVLEESGQQHLFTIAANYENQPVFNAEGYVVSYSNQNYKKISMEDIQGIEMFAANYEKSLYSIFSGVKIDHDVPNELIIDILNMLKYFLTDPNGRLMEEIEYLTSKGGVATIELKGPNGENVVSEKYTKDSFKDKHKVIEVPRDTVPNLLKKRELKNKK